VAATSITPTATTSSSASFTARSLSKSYETSIKRESVPLPANGTARTQQIKNEKDGEPQKESYDAEKRDHKSRERDLPVVPTKAARERSPEARHSYSERTRSPVREMKARSQTPNPERPRSPVLEMKARSQTPKPERPRAPSIEREPVKPSIQTTPTRTPLARTKSVPNLPVLEEPLQESEEKDKAELMLEDLLKTAHQNDIYFLFEIDAATPMDAIGKRRRQLTQQLHPDNFVKGSEEWNDAQQRMARVNQVYNNVLRKDNARALYDKITMYRQSYAKLMRKSDGVLQTAANNLYSLRESLRTSNMPHFLVDELDQSLKMLRDCRGIRPQL